MCHRHAYDADIGARLSAAAMQVAEQNERVEFLFCPMPGDALCQLRLQAVAQARARCPEKVGITLVRLPDAQSPVPDLVFDAMVTPWLPELKNERGSMRCRQVTRWMVQRSTHVIRYAYELLCDCEVRLRGRAALRIIDIAAPATAQAILDKVPELTEREQTVLRSVRQGATLAAAGARLGMSGAGAGRLLRIGCMKLRKTIRQDIGDRKVWRG